MNPIGFTPFDLGDGLLFHVGELPAEFVWSPSMFATAWELHPAMKPTIFLHGREVTIPRWQQAYGADYQFSGQVSRALPVPELLQQLLNWSRETIHQSLNGLLLNWYDGPGHYIGPHRDSTANMIAAAPIVTISFGEARKFRLSHGRQRHDFLAENGSVFVLPQTTNAVWKHSVPKSTRYRGQRISVTIRAFRAVEPQAVARG